ncbi:cytochrome P450 [Caballeronia arationis]|jgi:cytochrome P450|uniref:Cytochrome P450 n=1 Tax=Caballeronia arationis TaxID=1777142 RepID=A0A7Z7IE90_9BURK|nr:cytochrome P450 [Caballeronia arationis]SAK65871.1 cytochrome P450 [Caballeronia arationis]SOE89145.1 Cytochrome P450 [Caballeronia arationis]
MDDYKASAPDFPMRRCPFAPPPEYAEIRKNEGLSKVTMPDGSEAWIATRYDDVRAILGDPRFSTAPSTPGYPFIAPARAALLKNEFPPTIIRMDAPQHTKYRRMLSKEFMVHHIDAMRPELQKTVDTLLDEFIAKGSPADLFEDFALTVPTTVISRMLGVPYEDRDFFQERSKAKLDLTADPEVPIRAGVEMREYLDRLITEKMAHPGNRSDLISRLVTSQVVPGHMTREEALATIELLLMGGHETTANMIALGTLSLLTHPEQKDALVADPSLVRNTVEEMLRFHTIVHYNGPRVAMEDVEVAGTLIRKGEGVLALITAANRDPKAFDHPDRFDIHRPALHHVAFSYGVHQCLGQPLARAELQIVFTTLFQRLPKLRLAVPVEDIKFRYDAFVYGVDALPVEW